VGVAIGVVVGLEIGRLVGLGVDEPPQLAPHELLLESSPPSPSPSSPSCPSPPSPSPSSSPSLSPPAHKYFKEVLIN
jgi:hypothetical protein